MAGLSNKIFKVTTLGKGERIAVVEESSQEVMYSLDPTGLEPEEATSLVKLLCGVSEMLQNLPEGSIPIIELPTTSTKLKE